GAPAAGDERGAAQLHPRPAAPAAPLPPGHRAHHERAQPRLAHAAGRDLPLRGNAAGGPGGRQLNARERGRVNLPLSILHPARPRAGLERAQAHGLNPNRSRAAMSHSGLIFARCTTWVHCLISFLASASRTSGLPPASVTPILAAAVLTSSSARSLLTSALT